jgi:tetratricopeptide (TPR) repeat protein
LDDEGGEYLSRPGPASGGGGHGRTDNLGEALQQVGRFEEAITACEYAIVICRATGERLGEGDALANLGNALQAADRLEEAIAYPQEAVTVFRETGDWHRESIALENLARAQAAQLTLA